MIAEGLATAREALALIASSQERYCEPETHRVLGELQLLQGGEAAAATAERCFHDAISISRRLGARSWELRAALSLARLWAGEHRAAEAYALLQPIRAAFKEGFESPDLVDSARLLEQLRAPT